jgi:hypothetical protein
LAWISHQWKSPILPLKISNFAAIGVPFSRSIVLGFCIPVVLRIWTRTITP